MWHFVFAAVVLAAPTNLNAAPGLSKPQLLDQTCAKIAEFSEAKPFAEELSLICDHGHATPKFAVVVASAYEGQGDPNGYIPFKVASEGDETEMTILAAQKFPKPMAEVLKANDKGMIAAVDKDGVKSVTQLLVPIKVPDQRYHGCYKVAQTLTTAVGFLSFDDKLVSRECAVTLAAEPGIGLIYRNLDPTAKNPDNRFAKQLSVLIQDGGTTYVVFLGHMTVNNMHFASLTEAKMKATSPALARSYYETMMQTLSAQ